MSLSIKMEWLPLTLWSHIVLQTGGRQYLDTIRGVNLEPGFANHLQHLTGALP